MVTYQIQRKLGRRGLVVKRGFATLLTKKDIEAAVGIDAEEMHGHAQV